MGFDRANIYLPSTPDGEFWQGEILSDLLEYQWVGPDGEANLHGHPLAIVFSADCDLTQDHEARKADLPAADKLLPNILLCDVVCPAEDLKGSNALKSKLWTDVKKNKSERYHYLAEVPAERDLEGTGFTTAAIDFKQYFCISVSHLRRQLETGAKRRCRLAEPFAQHAAQRFFYYQSRIGLPVEHDAAPSPLPPTAPD